MFRVVRSKVIAVNYYIPSPKWPSFTLGSLKLFFTIEEKYLVIKQRGESVPQTCFNVIRELIPF